MGCCSSTGPSFEEIEEGILKLENTLEICKISVTRIDRILHRFSYNLIAIPAQFDLACKEMNINHFSNTYELFKLFFNDIEQNYNIRQITTLGILYGFGSKAEKLTVLFENYDTSLSKSLDSNEITLMLKEIIEISFGFILKFASGRAKGITESSIDDYKSSLLRFKSTLNIYYRYFFFEENIQELSFSEFEKAFDKTETCYLLNPHENRVNSKKTIHLLSNKADLVMYIMENPDVLDRKLTKRIREERKFRSKKHRSLN